jgi:hypothetical protein
MPAARDISPKIRIIETLTSETGADIGFIRNTIRNMVDAGCGPLGHEPKAVQRYGMARTSSKLSMPARAAR